MTLSPGVNGEATSGKWFYYRPFGIRLRQPAAGRALLSLGICFNAISRVNLSLTHRPQPTIQIRMGSRDHPDHLRALHLSGLICFPMALRAANELKVFDIIARAGPKAQLTSSEIVSKINTANPCAAAALERILRILVANSILIMSTRGGGGPEGTPEHVYGLSSDGRCLVPAEEEEEGRSHEGLSVAALVQLSYDTASMDGFNHLVDAVVDGRSTPFHAAHGRELYEFVAGEPKYMELFYQGMRSIVRIVLNEVLQVYRGLDDVNELVDAGGGIGTSISLIVSRYPNIRGVNFDLPSVIAGAPRYKGVEHVAGNMFESVPKAEAIFMRAILHNWDDDHCIKLLKNCWNALPKGGKVMNVEFVIPTELGTDHVSCYTTGLDLIMMACSTGGRERTVDEYLSLANRAGFADTKIFPIRGGLTVMEFYKTP
ncbi:hypothetical protein ACLOJK_013287 [Asimina triloba]